MRPEREVMRAIVRDECIIFYGNAWEVVVDGVWIWTFGAEEDARACMARYRSPLQK